MRGKPSRKSSAIGSSAAALTLLCDPRSDLNVLSHACFTSRAYGSAPSLPILAMYAATHSSSLARPMLTSPLGLCTSARTSSR